MSPRERRLLLILILVVAPALSLGLVWLFGPKPVSATGSMTITNTLANLAAGSQPLSLIDTNFTDVRTYVNNREVTVGTFGARPAAGTSGRYYLANDVGGNTFYLDNGSSWLQVAASVTSSNFGMYATRGLIAGNASLTTVNASATLVNLRNPSDNSLIVRSATAITTNDALTTGANGRDQTAQFTANSWVHLYYIWNGTTLATLSSACAPQDANSSCSNSGGPVLPSTYTHWAYIGAWRVTTSNTYLLGDLRGSSFVYRASQSLFNAQTDPTEKTLSYASFSAPNARTVTLNVRMVIGAGGAVGDYGAIRLLSCGGCSPVGSGDNYFRIAVPSNVASGANDAQVTIPNIGQQFFYYITASTGNTSAMTVGLSGFTVPNGE